MRLFEWLYNWFNSVSLYFERKLLARGPKLLPEASVNLREEESTAENIVEPAEDGISLARRTLKTRLYALEQEIELFKDTFSQEYQSYLNEINTLREVYDLSLEAISTQMTFEIDPELNSQMNSDIARLEREISRFIESEVKFDSISKKLQMLIVKLNLLYNVSIEHPNENGKVISQILRAIEKAQGVAKEFKECQYILADNQLKEWIVTLISYADYHIFKTSLRNSQIAPQQIVDKLVLTTQFKDFDLIGAFRAFLEDELSDFRELVPFIETEEYRKVFEKKIAGLLKEIAYATDMNAHLMDRAFWSKVFELESSLLEFLKGCNGLTKEQTKVRLIKRVNVTVEEKEVLTSPKTETFLALNSLYSTTRDERIFLLTRLFKNVSDGVTYKEIYFLMQLFGAIDIIKKTPNKISNHMEKYFAKYPYDSQVIERKKMDVLKSTSVKEYVNMFALDVDEDKIIRALRRLNFDFELRNDGIYLNSFYFTGLEKAFTNQNTTK